MSPALSDLAADIALMVLDEPPSDRAELLAAIVHHVALASAPDPQGRFAVVTSLCANARRSLMRMHAVNRNAA